MLNQVSARPLANLGLAFLYQNAAIGFTFGCIGLLIEPISSEFGASRSTISLSIGSISLIFGLLGPLVGSLLDRWSVRLTMMIGCLLSALGFYFSSIADSATTFLLPYAFLVGAGFTFMGVLPSVKIASLWFPGVGRATGFVSVPLLNAVGPPLFSMVLVAAGWRELLGIFALVMLGLFVVCFVISVPKKDTGQGNIAGKTDSSRNAKTGAEVAADSDDKEKSVFRDFGFWVISLSKGLVMSSGIVAGTHIVAHAIDIGIERVQASIILSAFGAASVLGALLFGWLCDRFSAVRMLQINALVQLVLWLVVQDQSAYYALVILMAGIGLCTGGVSTISLTILSRYFPIQRFGAASGSMMMLMIPFTFIAAPVAGGLYDWLGNYTVAFTLQAGLCFVSIILLNVFRSSFKGI